MFHIIPIAFFRNQRVTAAVRVPLHNLRIYSPPLSRMRIDLPSRSSRNGREALDSCQPVFSIPSVTPFSVIGQVAIGIITSVSGVWATSAWRLMNTLFVSSVPDS